MGGFQPQSAQKSPSSFCIETKSFVFFVLFVVNRDRAKLVKVALSRERAKT
jgi:hypothetical protein